METDVLSVAIAAAGDILTPLRLGFLALGVIMGLILGVIPGMSGIVGLSLLLPFTFDMDITTALAFLLGLSSVVVTGDTIPAVLFGVPGTVGSAATVLDGYPMARQGRAAEAFGAAFSASVIGGLFGALVLGVSIPILRPLMLEVTTPELLAICIVGLSLVAVLSGASPMKGLIACCMGLALQSIGDDIQTATLRWTFDTIYLYDGIPIVPVALGLFAIPELADLVIARKNISADFQATRRFAQIPGILATLRRLFLVVRCASIGSILGSMPGIGASIIDWIAYAHAKSTEKGANESFGSGDVRGVIASESANNAKEGGALVPTIAFGVPGSASMAILLGAFVIQGINTGPKMLTDNLELTYSMVWSIAIANVLGAGICFMFANQFARIALIPIGILAPVVLSFVFVGAFQGSNDWGDIGVLFGVGALGIAMKRLGWARPPLILGFVLGELLERYTFISVSRYGIDWIFRPAVAILLVLALTIITRPFWRGWKDRKRASQTVTVAFQRTSLDAEAVFIAAITAVFLVMLYTSNSWPFGAKLFPQAIAIAGLLCICIYAFQKFFLSRKLASIGGFDIADDLSEIDRKVVVLRLAGFVGLCALFVIAAQIVGFLLALFIFSLTFVKLEGKRDWLTSLAVASGILVLSYLLFHVGLRLFWPDSIVGAMLPATRASSWTDIF